MSSLGAKWGRSRAHAKGVLTHWKGEEGGKKRRLCSTLEFVKRECGHTACKTWGSVGGEYGTNAWQKGLIAVTVHNASTRSEKRKTRT